MSLKRRQFLTFFGAAAGTVALGGLHKSTSAAEASALTAAPGSSATLAAAPELAFKPVKAPMPYDTMGLTDSQQADILSRFAIQDDLVLPEGYTYDIIVAWGDPMGSSRCGYNNDYLSLVETAPGEGYLTINFEYISGATWMQTYGEVMGQELPFAEVIEALAASDGEIDVASLADGSPLKEQIIAISKEALVDQGIGVIGVRREADGRWVRTFSEADRRITGISGLEDGNYLKVTGPATAVFTKADKLGYEDNLGASIIGTFQNCSGGTTPWGTVLSAEENFQDQVHEPVMADGSAFDPANTPFLMTEGDVDGRGNTFGLAGNKYGWMVEVDPANASDYGVKHSWLGRFRHEAVAVWAVADKRLAVYSGCDRRSGHLYKFVSAASVSNPQSKGNSRLMAEGMLYAAKINADGTGRWIALAPGTAVDPYPPSALAGGMITLPKRPEGGVVKVESDADVAAFKRQYATLDDLYVGSPEEKQGAILVDAHYAANAAGATPTARPEDTDIAADGTLYIAYTSGSPGSDGGPSNAVFQGPNGEQPYEFGWIMKLRETDNDPAAMTFRWEMISLGGEPAEGGAGFANPDNLEIDRQGNLWMVTDISTSKQNEAIPSRLDESGEALDINSLSGLFGSNSIWYLPVSGPNAGEAYMFGYGPTECEMTGPFLSPDMRTLFLAAQHPGERNGMRMDMAGETRSFAMQTTDGQPFQQQRYIPLGSNWPSQQANQPPKPAVVAVRRLDGGELV